MTFVRNVLSIAGSDPSGGAGIQADLKTFAALGTYGCAVVTALTAQNTVQVSAVLSVPGEFVRRQLDAVFSDVQVHAVKIGMLGSLEVVRAVAVALRTYTPPHVVLDPVMRATTGAAMLDLEGCAALREELLPLATLVTPNAAEAGVLLGAEPPRSVADAREAAVMMVRRGAGAVLVTGGHLATVDECVDVLHDGEEMFELRVPRIQVAAPHGTGCTLSSAVAALLAGGLGLQEACARAQLFVAQAIRDADHLSVGCGATPLHHGGRGLN